MGRRQITNVALVVAGLALSGCEAERVVPDPFVETGHLVALSGGDSGAANACFTCHGLDGRGDGSGAPRLAGLDVGYLNRQMEFYAAGLRQHPQMQSIAKRLGAEERQAVAAYYATMPFTPSPAREEPAPELYTRGDPARQLWACANCHGAAGEGRGPANPPLGGQPAAYLAEQMYKWRRGERRGDAANMMLAISQRLTPAEIDAVSLYAAGLAGARPHSQAPATSPSERRADPRNGASAPLPREAE